MALDWRSMDRWDPAREGYRSEREMRELFAAQAGGETPTTTATSEQVRTTTYPQAIYSERQKALEQSEADRQAALGELQTQQAKDEATLIAARDAGLMTEEEYQQREAQVRQSTEAQFEHLSREMGGQTYGLSMGARRGGAREVGMGRAQAVGGIPGVLGQERAARRTSAYSQWGTQLSALGQRYGLARAGIRERAERPIPKMPTAFDPTQAYTALTGRTVQPPTPYNPYANIRGGIGFSDRYFAAQRRM